MYNIKECIIVEGVYDKIKLSSFINGTIFVTHGFSVFNNKKTIDAIRTFATKCGVVILTDSDSAGFKIRNYIKQAIPDVTIKHAYIPEVPGKERRKSQKSKEGFLGVEGIDKETIIKALENAGCTINDKVNQNKSGTVTKTDFFDFGLSGKADSSNRRKILCQRLNLPSKISANMLISSINSLMSREEFIGLCNEIFSVDKQ